LPSAAFGAIEGIIGGASLGVALGYLESRKPAEERSQESDEPPRDLEQHRPTSLEAAILLLGFAILLAVSPLVARGYSGALGCSAEEREAFVEFPQYGGRRLSRPSTVSGVAPSSTIPRPHKSGSPTITHSGWRLTGGM
jgi:hypothetical protein